MHTRLFSPTCLYQKSMYIYLGNNQQNQVHKFIMVLFTKQSLKNVDNGCDITDLLFLHHIFIMLIGISSPQPFWIPDCSICVFDPIRTIGIHSVPYTIVHFKRLGSRHFVKEMKIQSILLIYNMIFRKTNLKPFLKYIQKMSESS